LKINDFAPTAASWPKISGRRGRLPPTILLLRRQNSHRYRPRLHSMQRGNKNQSTVWLAHSGQCLQNIVSKLSNTAKQVWQNKPTRNAASSWFYDNLSKAVTEYWVAIHSRLSYVRHDWCRTTYCVPAIRLIHDDCRKSMIGRTPGRTCATLRLHYGCPL